MPPFDKVASVMRLSRLFYPLFFAFSLLSVQLGGAMHAVSHAWLEQTHHQDKQAPHQHACEQCEAYAQLGNALNGSGISFALHAALSHDFSLQATKILQRHNLAATARGPPALQIIV
jgi:hypothetical protein